MVKVIVIFDDRLNKPDETWALSIMPNAGDTLADTFQACQVKRRFLQINPKDDDICATIFVEHYVHKDMIQ